MSFLLSRPVSFRSLDLDHYTYCVRPYLAVRRPRCARSKIAGCSLRFHPRFLAFGAKAGPAVPRIKQLSIHVSAGEFLRLAAAAEATEMTPTAWVRHQALRTAG